MKESNMPKADFLMGLVFIVFGIGVLVISSQMPTFADRGANPYSAPGIVPGFLGAIIAFLGGVLFVRAVTRKGYRLGITPQTVREFFTSPTTKRLLITVLVSIVYAVVILGRIPYPIATGLYVLIFVLLFDYEIGKPVRQQWKTILTALVLAVLASAVVSLVFRYVFLVNLPG